MTNCSYIYANERNVKQLQLYFAVQNCFFTYLTHVFVYYLSGLTWNNMKHDICADSKCFVNCEVFMNDRRFDWHVLYYTRILPQFSIKAVIFFTLTQIIHQCTLKSQFFYNIDLIFTQCMSYCISCRELCNGFYYNYQI